MKKRLLKYLIPLILCIVVVCVGVFMFFFCAPTNTGLTYEVIKVSSTSSVENYYPRVYKHICKTSLNIFSDKEDVDDLGKLNIKIYYSNNSGQGRIGGFSVTELKGEKTLVVDVIFDTFSSSKQFEDGYTVFKLEGYFENNPTEVFEIKQHQTSTTGRSLSYLLFAAGGVCVAVFGVLIVYELTSPLKKESVEIYEDEDYAYGEEYIEDDSEIEKTKLEIEKLKLENEQLKIRKEMTENENKEVVCEHCGSKVSVKNSVCPNCKAPIKIK